MTDPISSMNAGLTAAAMTNPVRPRGSNWFEAFATAWGSALDGQAAKIEAQSDLIGPGGQDNPSEITKLTAESMRMGFMANSSHTSLDSVSKALETMARKG
ncbi:hypothetical protein SAMN06297144_1548 [Sphingomonas guangdongensis]|uniref:Uncharacterized protein n=1 Tax=Sphingomonas guangdongensis TaxID=1141890 RepID=A0A285QWZ1_9SPHN|nr:hypothetical protein [Sphingomonas guangdongensis]SOB86443.1 hypothetical protein SAMN06297144_1548 [Sphingomonas guangdongensis]